MRRTTALSAGPTSRRRPSRVDLQGVLFAAFLSAGHFKGNPSLSWLPVDLTVSLALASIVLAAYALLRSGFRWPRSLGWIVTLYLLFFAPLLWTEWTPYAREKALRLFTLTLLATALPPILFTTREQLRRFFTAAALIGLLMTMIAAAVRFAHPDALRMTVGWSNTIALGREAGMAAIWLVLLGLEGGRARSMVVPILVGPVVIVMLGSGARGPFVASMVALSIGAVLYYTKSAHRRVRLIAIVAALALFVTVGLPRGPETSSSRVRSFLAGELGVSGQARIDAYSSALERIALNPLGTGWGGFENVHQRAPGPHGGNLRYPHNLLLETLFEGGWLVGAFLVGLVAAGLHRTWRLASRNPSTELVGLLMILVFHLMNALVSGDVNDNRFLFACLALGLSFHTGARRADVRRPLGSEHGYASA